MDLSKVTAYKVIKEKKLTDIRSTGYLLRHIKTGARGMLIVPRRRIAQVLHIFWNTVCSADPESFHSKIRLSNWSKAL